MFWERFCGLCKENHITPSATVKKVDISTSVITNWKNGALPNSEAIIKLCNFFECSADYLLGLSDSKRIAKKSESIDLGFLYKKVLAASLELNSDNLQKLGGFANILLEKQSDD